MANFCKNEDCPSSEDLLDFQTGELSEDGNEAIRKHLGVCEFCVAEVDFYSHYPPAEETVEAAQIPRPLFELAEALLSKRADDAFDKLMNENEGLSNARH